MKFLVCFRCRVISSLLFHLSFNHLGFESYSCTTSFQLVTNHSFQSIICISLNGKTIKFKTPPKKKNIFKKRKFISFYQVPEEADTLKKNHSKVKNYQNSLIR